MSNVRYDFHGKSVLVTGGSRGIGYGIAHAFVKAGADVTILADAPDVHEAADRLHAGAFQDVGSIQCDITDVASVREVFENIGSLDILINNAGLEQITPILNEDEAIEETFRRVADINMMGTFYVTRYAVQKMRPGSAMIFTCSIWSRTAVAEFSAYCASNATPR